MSVELQQLLKIENNKKLWEIKCPVTDLPIWPLIRIVYLREIISQKIYNSSFSTISAKKSSIFNELYLYIKALNWNSKIIKEIGEIDVLFITNSVADININGSYKNRLTDEFSIYAKNSLTLLEQHKRKHPFPRLNSKILLRLPYQIKVIILSAIQNKLENNEANIIANLFFDEANKNINWNPNNLQKNKLIKFAKRKIRQLPKELELYRKLLKKIKPKKIIGLGLGYGPMMPLLVASRELNIKTAEFQHGVISSGHDAYNFGNDCLKYQELKMMLPDDILLYGSWWESQFNMPINKIIIGNPERIEIEKKITNNIKKRILILGDGLDTFKYINLYYQISSLIESAEILFRPHPLERDTIKKLNLYNKINIDSSGSIYEAFNNCDIIISEISTGLFDAIDFVPKILVWKTPKTTFNNIKYPFQEFTTIEEFYEIYSSHSVGLISEDIKNKIWNKNCVNNFKMYISNE